MKTKNIIAILVALPILAGLVGCKSDDQPEAKPAKEVLMVLGGDVIQYRASETGPSTEVSVKADCRWTVELNRGNFGDDLSVNPRQGNGNGTLVITSDQNTTPGLLREATITLVSDGGLRQKITVRQTGGDDALNLSKTSFNFTATTTEAQLLTITSNTSWQILAPSGVNWVHFSRTSSTDGQGPIEITVDNAVSDATRTAAVAITYGSGKSAQFEVTQEGITNVSLRVPTEDIRWSYEPNTDKISVESNAEWHAYIPSSATWLRFEGLQTSDGHSLSGVGNGEFRIMCEENNTSRDRLSAVVIIAGTKNPQQAVVVVEQKGNSSPQPLQTSVSITNLSTLRESAKFLLNIVSESVVGQYGLVYSATNQMPTRDNAQVVMMGQGGLSQGAVGDLTGLVQGTTYFVRGFVENIVTGETLYSDVVSIQTPVPVTIVGELYSMLVADTYAEFRFSFVADEEAADYGLVYSASNQTPTINDNVKMVGEKGTSRSVLGEIKNLQENTTYYVRAYVHSSSGNYVYSPNVVTITTSPSHHEPGESDNPDPTLAPRR
jgi:hypothetical protein